MSLDFMDALEAEVARVADDPGLRTIVMRGAVLATMGTPDQGEGIQAFLEKRRPRLNQGSE